MPINIFFYGYAFLFFFLDIFCSSIFEQKFFYFLLSFYSIAMLGAVKYSSIFFLSILLASELFLEIDHFGASLVAIIIISIVIFHIRPYLYEDATLPICITFIFLWFFIYFFRSYYSHFVPLESYTFYTICVNIIVLLIMLKFLFKGKRSNRFYVR